jgi:polyisoprenyl-teichoic acid--peptidoglycan teichoic acid transferase
LKRSKINIKSLVILSLIIIIVLATGIYLYYQVRIDRITEIVESEEPINILFVIYEENAPLLTEVFLYHPVSKKGALLDIPGNTGLIIESLERVDRIDTLYTNGGIEDYKTKIQQLIGIEIPFYIEFDLSAASDLVDIVDGIEIFISHSVEKIDSDEKTLIPSGNVILDGSKCISFLTYSEEGESDLDKIGRKQKFIQSILKKWGERSDFVQNDKIIDYIKSSLHTNMEDRALRSFLEEIGMMDVERTVFQRTLGNYRMVDDQSLLFPHFEGQLLRQTVNQINETIKNTDIIRDEELYITIEILNGTDISGLARRTKEVFESFGFDIVSFGNSDNGIEEFTVVLNRSGDITKAQKAAEIIQCSRILTEVQDEADSIADVTIILGKDFDGRYCKE